jgi:hypothetical protein
MRIHSDSLTHDDIHKAARIARVSYGGGGFTKHGSRKRKHAFNVLLTGESRRRPNGGSRGAGDDYAATWDQWGVFLAVLFDADPNMVTPHYADAAEFHQRTSNRFDSDGSLRAIDSDSGESSEFWPADAHGDHTFRFSGVPRQQNCTKCSATQRW